MKGSSSLDQSLAGMFVGEYSYRMTMKELGFTSPLSEICPERQAAYCLIANEIGKIRKADMDMQAAKNRAKRGKR